jgi:hypothetical protein
MANKLNMELLEELNATAQAQKAQVVNVTNAEKGTFTVEDFTENINPFSIAEDKLPYPRDHRGRVTVDPTAQLLETATGSMSTANFPELLRQGVRFDSFLSYRGVPTTWQLFTAEMQSMKQKEQWLKDAGLGIPPIVHEGEDYPEATMNLDSSVEIVNYKRGYRMRVTEEMRRFDMVGKVRQIAQQVGRSFRMGEETAVYDVLTTAANYTRNSTTGDNDVGANTAATTFSPTGLLNAWRTLVTMKDRKSGDYLGVQPDTLIIGPALWFAAKQLINSPQVMRIAADADGDKYEVYGTGTTNSFFDIVSRIIISPWHGSSYGWSLIEANRPLMFQRVAPFEILGPDFKNINDTWHYRARNWFGVGMLDDRFAYLSTSTTAPTVD